MKERGKEAANWAITLLLLGWVYVLAQRVAVVEERTRYFHGDESAEERHTEGR
jgi:hypothetical protein